MTTDEHLFTIVGEECAEIAKVSAKILRFGLHDSPPGVSHTNAELLMQEFDDLCGVIKMLQDRGLVRFSNSQAIRSKYAKVIHHLAYSKQKGTLQ